jgi:response regulator RpfG family c-di-GMP phosphodiesterase
MILLKPGQRTPEKLEIMKTHTAIGANAITSPEQSSQSRDNS